MNVFVHVFNCTYVLKFHVLLIREGEEGKQEVSNERKYRGRERVRNEGGEEATKKEKQKREARSSEPGFGIFRSPPGMFLKLSRTDH